MEKFAQNGIIINAQAYSTWKHKLHHGNIGRGVAEFIFQNYKDMMDQLREVDNIIRDIALGKSDVDISVRDAIAEAKNALKQNRLIDALYYSAIVNVIAQEVLGKSSETVNKLKTELYKQYSGSESPQAMEFMEKLKAQQQKAATVIAENNIEIKKYAQFLEGVYRTFFGDPLQKSWQAEIKKFRGPVEKAVNKAEQFANNMLMTFDQMGIARASGKVGDWVSGLDRIGKLQPEYNTDILSAFTQIQPLLEAAKQKPEMSNQIGSVKPEMLNSIMLDIFKKKEEVAQPSVEQKAAPAPVAPKVETSVGAPAGSNVPGVPVGTSSKPRPSGRPPKTITETVGVDSDELYKLLVSQGKTEEEIKDVFDSLGLNYSSVKKTKTQPESHVATEPPVAEEKTEEEPFELTVRKYLEEIQQMDEVQILNVVDVLSAAVENSGENETVESSDGEIIGSIEDGKVSVEGLEVPTEKVPELLQTMKQLPEYKPKAHPGTTVIGPSKDPILLGPIPEEKKPEIKEVKPETQLEQKPQEPKKRKIITEVDPNIPPPQTETKSDRIIIFTNIKNHDTKKKIELLYKILSIPVNVMTPEDRKFKEKYPNAEYYVLGIPAEEGEKEFPKEAMPLLESNLTKITKEKLRELFGRNKKPSVKKQPAKTEPKSTEQTETSKPKKETSVVETEEKKAEIIEPGEAKYENIVANVNSGTVSRFLEKSRTPVNAEDADKIFILLQGKFTYPEIAAAAGALSSFFEKEVIMTLDRTYANKKYDEAEKASQKVALFMWDRSDFRSAIDISKETSQEISATASVEEALLRLSNKRFFNDLKKAAEFNDPYLMAQMMLNYSEAIEDKDEELSIKLLAKAQELLNE